MNLEEVFQTYKDCIVPSYTKVPLVFVKGKGNYLWDIHSRKYLDFFPGWGSCNLGHCHPKVMCAVRDQVSKLIFVPNTYYNLPQAQLAKELNYWTREPFKVFYGNSGAEANEAAIKLSRKAGKGRFEIITCRDAFHGRTLAALAATGQAKYQEGFAPMIPGFKSVEFNNLDAVRNAITPQTIAVMLELVQGEGGVNVASEEYAKGLRQLCDEKNLLLIIDEVQTGIGRIGTMFGWQHYGVVPDIFTLAKSLGGGLPIGAMLARPELADNLTPGTHASTFGGGAVICKAALAVLRAMQKEKMLANVALAGGHLMKRLQELKNEFSVIKDVRGIGLMVGIELTKPGKPVVEACYAKGLLINCTHDTVLRVMPALNITVREIDKAVAILKEVLKTTPL